MTIRDFANKIEAEFNPCFTKQPIAEPFCNCIIRAPISTPEARASIADEEIWIAHDRLLT